MHLPAQTDRILGDARLDQIGVRVRPHLEPALADVIKDGDGLAEMTLVAEVVQVGIGRSGVGLSGERNEGSRGEFEWGVLLGWLW